MYKLDPSPKKFICPNCNKKRFVKYINLETEQYFADQYGRCDRELKCGYQNSPSGEYYSNTIPSIPIKPVYRITVNDYQKTLSNYKSNNLFLFLNQLFGETKTIELIKLYRIGTSKKWNGSTLFWQINSQGEIGQGKIMLFNAQTGKRVKEPFPHITSVHKQLGKEDQKPLLVFFGEHLLSLFPNKQVAIVESEKTALVMTGIDDSLIWVATSGLSNLNSKRLNAFRKRKLICFPDLGASQKWNTKIQDLKKMGFDLSLSTLLEDNATETDHEAGYDIADYYIKNILIRTQDSPTLQNMKTQNPTLNLFMKTFALEENKAYLNTH